MPATAATPIIPTEIPIAVELTPELSPLSSSLVEFSEEELGVAGPDVLSPLPPFPPPFPLPLPLPLPPVLEGFAASEVVAGGFGFVVEEVMGRGEGLGP